MSLLRLLKAMIISFITLVALVFSTTFSVILVVLLMSGGMGMLYPYLGIGLLIIFLLITAAVYD